MVSALPKALGLFQAVGGPPLAYTLLEPGQALSQAAAEAANAVLLGGVLAQADGTLAGQLPGVALDQAYAVYPVVRNYAEGSAPDPALLAALLGSDEARARPPARSCCPLSCSGGYDGLVLDYAGVDARARARPSPSSSHDLAAQLHSQGKSLFVQVAPPALTGDALEHRRLRLARAGRRGRCGCSCRSATTRPSLAAGWPSTVLGWAVGEVPRGRLRLLTTRPERREHRGPVQPGRSGRGPGAAGLGGSWPSGAEALAGEPLAVHLSGDVQSLAYDARAFAASYAYTDAGRPRAHRCG